MSAGLFMIVEEIFLPVYQRIPGFRAKRCIKVDKRIDLDPLDSKSNTAWEVCISKCRSTSQCRAITYGIEEKQCMLMRGHYRSETYEEAKGFLSVNIKCLDRK